MLSKLFLLGLTVWLGSNISTLPADQAKGTLSYQGKKKSTTINLTNVSLIKGPDVFEPSINFRRLIFSTTDLSAKLKACKTMDCTNLVFEGFQLDLVEGPRYRYWMVLNGQMTQYSGTCKPSSLILTTDSPKKLAGSFKLIADDAGGPDIEVTFEASLVNEFTK